MAITVSDLRFYASERMTDEDDGGGRMSAVEIASGVENTIFDDLSDVDRAAGDCSIRKVFAAVKSAADEKYLDPGIVIFRPPADPNVSVLAFSTGDFYDERTDQRNLLELSISRGGRFMGWLYSDVAETDRAITIWQRLGSTLPTIGGRLDLVAFESGTEEHNKIIWIQRVVSQIVPFVDEKGAYQIQVVTCELNDNAGSVFKGIEPTREDPGKTETVIYSTRYNQDAVELNGVKPLTESAAVGDRSVKVASLYAPLIPTSFSETALADTTPGGDVVSLVSAGSGAVAFSTALDAVGPGASLFCGSPVQPGSLSIVCDGSTITDSNGDLWLAGIAVGGINYSAGVCTWADTCPAFGTATKEVTFKPGAAPTRTADSASQVVAVENRGFVWVLTLAPIPAPGTLRVAYRANNEWYFLADQGAGKLSGADSTYGSALLNFATGTVTLTCGAMPDAESEIIYTWATAVTTVARGGEPVDAPKVTGKTANTGVRPGSVTVSWTVGADTTTLTDDRGALSGSGGTGAIDYATGEWWVAPETLPPKGTEFEIHYQHGTASYLEETFTAPALGGDGFLTLTLSQPPEPGSIAAYIQVQADGVDPNYSEDSEFIPKKLPFDELGK